MNSPPSEETILVQALRLTGGARETFLAEHTLGNPALRERIDSLLGGYESGEFLEEAADPALKETVGTQAIGEQPGERIGRYKLLEQIGEGGCGVVYVAAQQEPVKRRVALKIIKLGMDTKSVVARFEAERQALALMDHPNISKVLDAGATESGRPYFVMELVRGMKITDYCDEAKLSIRDRLNLFIQVCQAIQHAHQKGIIHRDIKPSNVLVTLNDGVPIPKVIDFGIAKATNGQRLTDQTIYTAFEQFIGTPAYMSPEQTVLTSVDIDTRSDIYALGVLLYELLTGHTPFDSKELLTIGLEEMRRTVCEREPARPSTRLRTMADRELSTAAQRRSATAPRLVSELCGDLDWIVMKALEKERGRRYATANGLDREIERFLKNEPVLACPPSAGYRLRKFIRRNKLIVTFAGAIALVLALGTSVSTWEAIQAKQAADEQRTLRQAAQIAQANEAQQRLRSEQQAYASDMNLAQQALASSNLGRAQELLDHHRPGRAFGVQSSRFKAEHPKSRIGVQAEPSTIGSQQPTDLRGWEWRYLWQQCRSDALYTLCQRSNTIMSLAASPDGQLLAVAEDDKGGLSVWDTRNRKAIASLPAGEARFFPTFSPNGSLLAFASLAGPKSREQPTVRLWNLATGQLGWPLSPEGDGAGLGISDDGKKLGCATGGAKGRITIWDLSSLNELTNFPAVQPFAGRVAGFAFSADLSKAAYSAPMPNVLRVVDLQSGQILWSAEAAEKGQRVKPLAFSKDGELLASAAVYDETAIRVWDARSGKLIRRLEGHDAYVEALLFWPDGKTLASASADHTIRIWDVPTGRLRETLRGHRSEVWSLELLPDSRTLISGGKDGSVLVWDTAGVQRSKPHIILPGVFLTWRFSGDGKSVLTVDATGRVTRWAGRDFQQPEVLLNYSHSLAGALITEDCGLVVLGRTNGPVEVWDLGARRLRHQLQLSDDAWLSSLFSSALSWHMGGCAITHSNRLVMSYYGAEAIREWDLSTGRELASWARSAGVRCAAFSPEGGQCLTFDWDAASILRHITDGRETELKLTIPQAVDVAYSPDGRLAAAASLIGYARLWEAGTFREVATLGGFPRGAHAVAFSPDAKRLVVGSTAREAIKLWDLDNYNELLTLEGPEVDSGFMAFSADGDVIGAMNSVDGTVHLWRAPSWSEIESAERSRKAPE